MRTVFMGTPDIAVPALQLLAARTTITCVITQPDRPAGRGHHLTPPPVKIAAMALGLPVWQPETLKGCEEDPRLQCDLAVVMAYGELLRQKVLDRPAHGCINLHASLLPRWRGASPLQAALRAGDTRTGVTVMRMVRALDAGAMFCSDEIAIGARMTLPELHDALMGSATRALGIFLDRFPQLPAIEQDVNLVTTCHKLTTEHGRLDFSVGAVAIDRWVRAYTPAPGCWVPLTDAKLKILAVEPVSTAIPVGQVVNDGTQVLIGCGADAVVLRELQAPGKRPMATGDFLRGNTLPGNL